MKKEKRKPKGRGGWRPNSGRPRKEFSEQQWEIMNALGEKFCTLEEISAFFYVNPNTLQARIAEKYEMTFDQWSKMRRYRGNVSLRCKAYAMATDKKKDNPYMLTFLMKNHLGMQDNPNSSEEKKTNNFTINLAYDPENIELENE